MAKLDLDSNIVAQLRQSAKNIAHQVQSFIDDHSTVSVERSILRLYGVDGIDESGVPLPNRVIDRFKMEGLLEQGAGLLFSKALLLSGKGVQDTAEWILTHPDSLNTVFSNISHELAQKKEQRMALLAIEKLEQSKNRKNLKKTTLTVGPSPWKYLIVATGNIYEDRRQAEAAALTGADIIAVIRTTAQSLLDYLPYGPTTEGFGGTMATQANFQIMRTALDQIGTHLNRYIMLTNYSSGLCMAEIACAAALEDLDMLLNDSMYGILFRDINMKRTFVDQFFSRLICASADIIINTGEDNYLTTADPIDSFYTVIASQLINEAMAQNAGLLPHLMGLGHAFEIDPQLPNAFLYEIAHAQLVRDLFPNYPLKYMPPTKHKSTDIFFSHAMDTMFNWTSIFTQQGIHLTGILTEAIHTPLMQDRYQSLSSVNYVFNGARDLASELEFKSDGFITKRAKQVLEEVKTFLLEVERIGLMSSIELGHFANIKRTPYSGKGLDGVFKKSSVYLNSIEKLLRIKANEN